MSTIQVDFKGLTPEQVQTAIDRYIQQQKSAEIVAKFRADQKAIVDKARKERGRRTRIVNLMQKVGVPVNPLKNDYTSNRLTKMNVAGHTTNQYEDAKGCFQLSMSEKHEIEFHKYLDILRSTLLFKIVTVQTGVKPATGNPINLYYIRFMGDN